MPCATGESPYEPFLRAHRPPAQVNRSRLILDRAGMVPDGGPPRCRGCGLRLQFGTDRDGRATESCVCGYYAYVKTRCGRVDLRQGGPAGGHASAVFTTATHDSRDATLMRTAMSGNGSGRGLVRRRTTGRHAAPWAQLLWRARWLGAIARRTLHALLTLISVRPPEIPVVADVTQPI